MALIIQAQIEQINNGYLVRKHAIRPPVSTVNHKDTYFKTLKEAIDDFQKWFNAFKEDNNL